MGSYQFGLFMAMWGAAFLLTRIGLAALFKKAGEKAWLAYIPVVSWWYWIKVVNRPKWYMIGMVIPCINILFSFNITLDLLRSYGQFKFWQHAVGTVLTFIYLPYMAFRKDVKYLGGAGDAEWRKKNIPPHRGSREWADALLFALYVAGGMRSLYFDLYQIPTPSMESNLMVGDFLVVSRAKIGMRIPMTPIAIPVLAHKELLGMQAFSDIVELPYMRLPGWYTIKNNDVIVFNYPADVGDFPVDKKENYVKRCVGIPGDSLFIRHGQVYINNKPLKKVGKQQSKYIIHLKGPMTQKFLEDYELWVCNRVDVEQNGQHMVAANTYAIVTWEENVNRMRKDPYIGPIFKDTMANMRDMHYGPFMDQTTVNGKPAPADLDNFGPFYLPKRGDEITLNPANWAFYELAITKYEKSGITSEDGGKTCYLNGEPVKTYKFKMGYYWMMGDNRYNSLDSRYWGYVPEDHIVGKPLFTFFSIKKVQVIVDGKPATVNNQGMEEPDREFGGIRWDKIFKAIE